MNNTYIKVHEQDNKQYFRVEICILGVSFDGRWPYLYKATAVQVAKNLARELGIEYRD